MANIENRILKSVGSYVSIGYPHNMGEAALTAFGIGHQKMQHTASDLRGLVPGRLKDPGTNPNKIQHPSGIVTNKNNTDSNTPNQIQSPTETVTNKNTPNGNITSVTPPSSNPSARPRIGIYDTITRDLISFYYVPESFKYSIDTSLVVIHAVGQNNPIYHFSGSSDELSFQIDWFSHQDSRQDVLIKCKKLEALAKRDGSGNPQHKVKLIWGNTVWAEANWIIHEASYTLSLPHAGKDGFFQQAIQQIAMYRVVDNNRTYNDIHNIRT